MLLGRHQEAAAQTYLYSLKNLAVTPKQLVDTIPISVQDNRIYVTLRIGQQDCKFLLDTGAGLGEVYAETGIALGPSLGKLEDLTDALGNRQGGEIVTLPTFSIGKLQVCNYPIQKSERPLRNGICGSLGFALFNKGIEAKIDVRNKALILTTERGIFKQESGIPLSYSLYRHTPQITLLMSDNTHVEAILDTGNPRFFLMDRNVWNAYSQGAPECAARYEAGRAIAGELRGAHGREAEETQVFLQLPWLGWGSYHFCDVLTRTWNAPSYVGAALLKYGALIIQPKRKRLLFQPYEDGNAVSVEPSFLRAIYFTPDTHGKARIGFVRPGSKLYKDGCRAGDLIQKINNEEIPDYATLAQHRFISGKEYVFALQSPLGFRHDVTMRFPFTQ